MASTSRNVSVADERQELSEFSGLSLKEATVARPTSASINSQDELYSRAQALMNVLLLLDRALHPQESTRQSDLGVNRRSSTASSHANQLGALADKRNDPHATLIALEEGLRIADMEARRLQRASKSGPFRTFGGLLSGSRPAKYTSFSIAFILDRIREERDAVTKAKRSLFAESVGMTPAHTQSSAVPGLSRLLSLRRAKTYLATPDSKNSNDRK
jgi:hypothetical protein